MVIGTGLFASVFEPIKGFYLAAQGPRGQTLQALFGLPVWAVIGGLIVIAAAGFALGNWCERKLGGPLTAEQLNEGEPGGVIGPDRDREPANQLEHDPEKWVPVFGRDHAQC